MRCLTKQQAWGRDGLMALSAVRYCLGRKTYITGDCADWLIESWPFIPSNVQKLIWRDVEEAFTRDDEDRAENRPHKTLGHDCDRQNWERVRVLWTGQRIEAPQGRAMAKPAAKAMTWTRADRAALATFDPQSKYCTHNCGRHTDDPRSDKERLYLCDLC